MDAKGGNMILKGGCKRGELSWKGGIMMCKFKGRMDKGHYDVQIKRLMKKVSL